jgi:hypothetical protein
MFPFFHTNLRLEGGWLSAFPYHFQVVSICSVPFIVFYTFLSIGVHLKALEVYDIILSRFHSALTLGDMHLFGLGILPLYAVASTTIRPSILQLYEKYFVNLPEDFIVSLLQGLLASILPGMDEASGEFYVRLTSLFDIIRSRLSHQDSFFQILWRTISDFPPCRLNALNYLLSKSGQLSISDSW